VRPPSRPTPRRKRRRRRAADETGGGGDEDLAGFTEMVGNQGGLTALLLAVRDGHTETVRALLDAGADINQ